ncbi:MAG TPA: GWxTD domain-containing protein [Candidatus Saccharimonadales bacterium]|nr:GWxTD domain-containing protein [Candidatus Saccharimonadales bacterium]
MSKRHSRIILMFPLLLVILASSILRASDPAKNLAPRYRHWINEEVPYIINSDERKEFLALGSDAEREAFIKTFWDVRNPNPGLETNDYRDEHYRRLAYANQFFGNIKAQDGWRTDQGHMYIVLGEPEQRANYPETRNVRPLLIWFYQAKTPVLPSHFYIVFYKRSAGEDFTLYSPYQDGPSRLVTGLEGKNDQKNNLDIIKRSLGDEVARTTLSLIPTEPVNLQDYIPSMQSDVMLSTIKSLADQPLSKELLSERKAIERVTTNIYLGTSTVAMQTAVFQDSNGRMNLDYLLSYDRPEQGIIGRLNDKGEGYSMTLQTSVLTVDGKSVYEQIEKLQGQVTASEAASARKKRFGAESRVPLAPGTYQVIATLTNNLNKSVVREHTEITVPDPSQTAWGISKILAFSPQPPIRDPKESLPFNIAGLRFAPRGIQQILLHPGEQLRLVFQLWSKPLVARQGQKIKIHYVMGTSLSGQEVRQEDEELDAGNFNAAGTLLTGRTLSTERLSMGNHRVVITATDEATQQKTYATVTFRIGSPDEATDLWTAHGAFDDSARGKAIEDYKRSLSAVMQGGSEKAVSLLQDSLGDDPTYSPALSKLVDLLSQTSQYERVAELSAQYPVSKEMSNQTAILMAQAHAQMGDFPAAAHILEQELQFQPKNAAVYLALAKVYEKQGNLSKAEDYKRQAAELAN